MLLAAEEGNEVKVLFADGKVGEEVKFGNKKSKGFFINLKNNKEQISFKQFSKLKMVVKDEKVVYNNKILNVDGKEIKVKIKDGAEVR